MSICPAQKTGCISFVAKGITVFQLCKSTGLQTEVTAGDLKWNMVLDSRQVMLQWRGKHSMVSCDIQFPLFCVMAALSYE